MNYYNNNLFDVEYKHKTSPRARQVHYTLRKCTVNEFAPLHE